MALMGCRAINPAFLDERDTEAWDESSEAADEETTGDSEGSDGAMTIGHAEAASESSATSQGDSSGTGGGSSGETTGVVDAFDCTDCESLDVDGRAFCLCASTGSWVEARDACASRGGVLASIATPQENETLAEAGSELVDVDGPDFWIGFTEMNEEGTWTWVDESPVAFTNWRSGAPAAGDGTEDCAELQLSNGQWNDSPCESEQQGFVCVSSGV